jgi:hypothetical protein
MSSKQRIASHDLLTSAQKMDLWNACKRLHGTKLYEVHNIMYEGMPEIRDVSVFAYITPVAPFHTLTVVIEQSKFEVLDSCPNSVLTKMYNHVFGQAPATKEVGGPDTKMNLKRKSMDVGKEVEERSRMCKEVKKDCGSMCLTNSMTSIAHSRREDRAGGMSSVRFVHIRSAKRKLLTALIRSSGSSGSFHPPRSGYIAGPLEKTLWQRRLIKAVGSEVLSGQLE